MSDELEKLKADWQRQETGISELRGRLDLLISQGRSKLAAAVVGTVVGIAIGIGYAVVAWCWHDVLFALSAVAMLVLFPCQMIPTLRLSRRILHFPDRTPEGTLRYAVTRLTLSMRLLRSGRLGVTTLAGLAAVVWAAVAVGLIPAHRYPPVVIPVLTGAWLFAALISTFTNIAQQRKFRRELAAAERMLAEFLAARQADLAEGGPEAPSSAEDSSGN
jgi:MFS family permease